jgi:hypothetical protein
VFIRKMGGRVFLWTDSAGVKRVRLHPPHEVIVWSRLRIDEVELMVDPSIAKPNKWVVVLRRFPRRRVDVLWDGQPGWSEGAATVG